MLRERRLAFRRRNTIRNEKSLHNQAPQFLQPTHPIHFQDRKYFKSHKIKRIHFSIDVIVCLHADKSSPTIGLRNFVMPLRASSFHRHELPTIIFVTDLDYIKNEWDMISTFPDIYILNVKKINYFFCIYNHLNSIGFTKQSI